MNNTLQFSNSTANVWPICLPLSETYQRDSFKELLTLIAGWGRVQEEGNSSDVLQTLYLPILKNSECKKQFRKQGKLISENQFDKTVICAGDLNGGHDSCKGDSGGPMMHSIQEGTKWRIYQIGKILIFLFTVLHLFAFFFLSFC